MTDNLPDRIYTEAEVAKTRRNAKLVGFVQGGATVFLVGLVLQFLSWVPWVLGAGVVGWAGWRFLSRKKGEEPAPEG